MFTANTTSASLITTGGAAIVYKRTGAGTYQGNLHFKTQAGVPGTALTKRLTILSTGQVGLHKILLGCNR